MTSLSTKTISPKIFYNEKLASCHLNMPCHFNVTTKFASAFRQITSTKIPKGVYGFG